MRNNKNQQGNGESIEVLYLAEDTEYSARIMSRFEYDLETTLQEVGADYQRKSLNFNRTVVKSII